MFIARRYGEVGLQELARFLQVKELSTTSHAVRRAEERLKEDSGFRRQADQILKRLDSSMQPDPFGLLCLEAGRCVIGRRDIKRVGGATRHRERADPGDQSYQLFSAKGCFGGCIGGIA